MLIFLKELSERNDNLKGCQTNTITTLVEHGYNVIDDNLPETENNSEMANYVKFVKRY